MGQKSITTFFLLSEEELKQYQKSQEIESVVVKSTVSSKHSTAATISPVESKVKRKEGRPKLRTDRATIRTDRATISCMILYSEKMPIGRTKLRTDRATISPVESKVKREEVKFGKFTWIVLDENESGYLLVTKNIVLYRKYNSKAHRPIILGNGINVTWAISDIRNYLNDNFYYKYFSAIERNQIVAVKIHTPDSIEYSTKGGRDTLDKIFLLSLEEVELHFPSNAERMARYHGLPCSWWLRSPGICQNRARIVSYDGDTGGYGPFVNELSGIRPALYLKSLDSLEGVK